MRFLILHTDYPEFLRWLYSQCPGLEDRVYDEQVRQRYESLFGVADFYSSNLRKLGHEAYDVYVNNEFMQRTWAKEHGVHVREPSALMRRRFLKSVFRRLFGLRNREGAWFYDILGAQIRDYQPDVLLNQAMGWISSSFMKAIKLNIRLIVGQIASPVTEDEDYTSYDLVISSLPNLVEYFRALGRPAELHRLGFEPAILPRLGSEEKKIAISFVGSLFPQHKARIELLEYLCRRLDVEVWGSLTDGLPSDSWIRKRYKGQAWGIEMYRKLHDSKMTLNHHIDIAESYANNLRLFEATGVGTMLMTDWKVNLHEMFEPGKEVVTYRSPEECAQLIQYYLGHDEEREAIARAGQQRTLQEHTFYNRMEELITLLSRYL